MLRPGRPCPAHPRPRHREVSPPEGHALPARFATEAKARLPEHEEFLLAPSEKGLRVLAKNEDGLALHVGLLREIYGPTLEVAPPAARVIAGAQVHEPSMHVRISLQPRFLHAVQEAMRVRGASAQGAEPLRPRHRRSGGNGDMIGRRALSEVTGCAAAVTIRPTPGSLPRYRNGGAAPIASLMDSAEQLLDEAIELTFPASDPIAVDHAFDSARSRDLSVALPHEEFRDGE